MRDRTMRYARLAAVALALVGAPACATIGVGGGGDPQMDAEAAAAKAAPFHTLDLSPEEFLATAKGTYVVVDLDTNRLRLMDGADTVWSALVGTGTGLRLQSDDGSWHFSTPRGVFQIQYKEEMPVWYLPDWYFVEKGLPVPPRDAPERKQLNQLGVAAVYIGEEIAIHGTSRPELLGQRVSHGCIRLHNDFARRLYHDVQIGTPVVVIGGEKYDTLPPPPTTDPGRPRPPEPDPLAGIPTAELLRRLDRAFAARAPNADWVRVTSRLITRGHKDDTDALRGLLVRAGGAVNEKLNREYAMFLADAYARGSLRVVVSLARIDEEARERAARAIVSATIASHPGGAEDPRAPWPTHRVPPTGLGPTGRAGWDALAAAEAEMRRTPAAVARTESR